MTLANAEELSAIYELFCKEQNFKLDKDALTSVHTLMKEAAKREDKFLGNGRFVRNAFEKTIENIARRVMQLKKPKKRDLQTVVFSDIPSLDDVLGQSTPKKVANGNVTQF